jgi:hypothetical protein
MKQRSPPLWLMCDCLCWLGVLFTVPALAKVFHRIAFAALAEQRGIRRSELSLAARLLAEAEAWLRYALMRRAFRLAGLKPSRVRFQYPGLAATKATLTNRARQLNRTFMGLDATARRAAHRLIRLQAAPEQARATAAAAIPGLTPPSADPSRRQQQQQQQQNATSARAGLRVRAPPWRIATADCRLPLSAVPPRRTHPHARSLPGSARAPETLRCQL